MARPATARKTRGRAPLTPEQIEELRQALLAKRAEIAGSIAAHREAEAGGEREVGDEMDEATDEGSRGLVSRLLEREVRLVREIDDALARIARGEYGLCEGTGEPIGYERLKLEPWTRYSVEYQEELEREARAHGP